MVLQHGEIHALERNYLVMCAKCHTQENANTYTQKQAAVEFWEKGWKKRVDGWTCPECIEQQKHDRARRAQ